MPSALPPRVPRPLLLAGSQAWPRPRSRSHPLPTGRPSPGWSERIRELREEWLTHRHALLLDMMRRHRVEMWIVVNEEFHDDPLTEVVAPRPYTGNRDFFVFVDAGPNGLKATRRHRILGVAVAAASRPQALGRGDEGALGRSTSRRPSPSPSTGGA